ncbi:MAG: RNA polymerase sigma factor [Elusimicrobiales bacterium]
MATDATVCDDNEMVSDILAGESASFRRIVEKYQKPLYDLAFRMTGNVEDAQDILQTSFIKMYSSLKDYDALRSFRNWAYTIVLNQTRSHLRRKALLRFLPFSGGGEEESGELDIADNSQNTENAVAWRQLLRDLEKNLLKLPPELREPFILYHFHNITVENMAAQLGISRNAVHIRLSRARTALFKNMPALASSHGGVYETR